VPLEQQSPVQLSRACCRLPLCCPKYFKLLTLPTALRGAEGAALEDGLVVSRRDDCAIVICHGISQGLDSAVELVSLGNQKCEDMFSRHYDEDSTPASGILISTTLEGLCLNR